MAKYLHLYGDRADFQKDYDNVSGETVVTSFTCNDLTGEFTYVGETTAQGLPVSRWTNGSAYVLTMKSVPVAVGGRCFDETNLQQVYTISAVSGVTTPPTYVEPWVSLVDETLITVSGESDSQTFEHDYWYLGCFPWQNISGAVQPESYFWTCEPGVESPQGIYYGNCVRTTVKNPSTGTQDISNGIYACIPDMGRAGETSTGNSFNIISKDESFSLAYNKPNNFVSIVVNTGSSYDFSETDQRGDFYYYSSWIESVGPMFDNSLSSIYTLTDSLGSQMLTKNGGPIFFGINPLKIYTSRELVNPDYKYAQIVENNGTWYVRTWSNLS